VTLAFWIAFAVILYTYIGYPVAIYLLAKIRSRKRLQAPYDASVSIVMSVSNGESMLPLQMQRLIAHAPHLVREIVVVSDASQDRTAEILRQQTEPRCKTIILEEHLGKAGALNLAVAAATGEILLFVDVRPQLQDDALEKLLLNFADPVVGCVTGELSLRTDGHDGAASAVSGLYWRYEQWIRQCEAAFDSPLGVYGGFYAMRRSLFTPFPEGLVLDDMFQPLAMTRQGYRSVIDTEAHVVDMWPSEMKGEFRRKVRTLAGNFQLIAVAPWLITPKNRLLIQLISHKLLRLVAPYCFLITLVVATILGLHQTDWFVVALMQWAFWAIAVAGLVMKLPIIHRLSGAAGGFLALNVAAVVGLYTFLFSSEPLSKGWYAERALAQKQARRAR